MVSHYELTSRPLNVKSVRDQPIEFQRSSASMASKLLCTYLSNQGWQHNISASTGRLHCCPISADSCQACKQTTLYPALQEQAHPVATVLPQSCCVCVPGYLQEQPMELHASIISMYMAYNVDVMWRSLQLPLNSCVPCQIFSTDFYSQTG